MFFKVFQSQQQKRIYLDYASSTPRDEKMIASFSPIPSWCHGANPSALHKEGVALKKVLRDARVRVAETLSAHPDEIIFTSNATESDNLGIRGPIAHALHHGVSPGEIVVVTSPFEHSAISQTLSHLHPEMRVQTLAQEHGVVDPVSLSVPEGARLLIVSVMYIQNEIGTVQPIKDIAKRIRKLRKEYPECTILFHTDATQAPLYYDLNVLQLGVDLMTLGTTKLYCSKGIGILYKKRGVTLDPILYGGGQEYGLRPGTEPVTLIHECAHALSYAHAQYEHAHHHARALQSYFETLLRNVLPSVKITGAQLLQQRSPHITHLVVPEIDSELLVLELDARGVAVSSKSACKNEDVDDSGILKLLYPNQNLGAIRISYGRYTTNRDLDKAIKALADVLKKYQK